MGELPSAAGPDGEAAGRPTTGDGSAYTPTPSAPAPRSYNRSRQIRRVPRPRMSGLLDSPARNLGFGVLYTVCVMTLASAAYMAAGWSFRDALHMVVITVFTVGYSEVRPIDTPALNVITISLIVLGCTGIIFLTGALVQSITLIDILSSLSLTGRRLRGKEGDSGGDGVVERAHTHTVASVGSCLTEAATPALARSGRLTTPPTRRWFP